MPFNYAALKSTATKVITQFGASATLRRDSGDRPCKAVEITETPNTGSLIENVERTFLISAALAEAPDKEQDTLVWNGAELRIMEVVPLAPASTVILFEVRTRV